MTPRPIPHLAALPRLDIGEAGLGGVGRVLRLNNNENVEQPSDAVLEAVARAQADANWYPDVTATALKQAIAETHPGVAPDRLVAAAGSGELIALLARAYSGPGDEVIIGRQGYLYFSIASMATGAKPVYVDAAKNEKKPGFDPQAALDAVTERTRIVFIDNPSNPLGVILTAQEIAEFRAALRGDILLVLDAAYSDYVTDPTYQAGEAMVDQGDNTVMLRTCSKIYGLAGLRVGWAYAPAAIVEMLARVQRPGTIASLSLAAAEAALRDRETYDDRKRRNQKTRDAFTNRLRGLTGVSVLDSHANFVFATLGPEAKINASDLFSKLRMRGVFIRPMAPYHAPESVRISIGTETDMRIAADAIESLLG